MTLNVTYENPDFPSDYEFGIKDLGLFTNGTGRDLTPEQEQAFVDNYGEAATAVLQTQPLFTVTGTDTATVPAEPQPNIMAATTQEEAPTTQTEGEVT